MVRILNLALLILAFHFSVSTAFAQGPGASGGSGSATSEGFGIQSTDNHNLVMIFGGPAGGIAEELVGYLSHGNATDSGNQAISYDQKPIWGWTTNIPTKGFTIFLPFAASELASMNLGLCLSQGNSQSTCLSTITLSDSSSAVLYDLMLKSGIKPGNDISKALYGRYVTCWGFHGYPGGQTVLDPTCRIAFEYDLSPAPSK
jgi:hypothetical protein